MWPSCCRSAAPHVCHMHDHMSTLSSQAAGAKDDYDDSDQEGGDD